MLERQLHWLCWSGGCIGEAAVLERWLHWRGGCVGEAAVLERWLHWRGGCIGEAAVLERQLHWLCWSGGCIGEAAVLERRLHWRGGCVGEAAALVVLEWWLHWRGGCVGEAAALERRLAALEAAASLLCTLLISVFLTLLPFFPRGSCPSMPPRPSLLSPLPCTSDLFTPLPPFLLLPPLFSSLQSLHVSSLSPLLLSSLCVFNLHPPRSLHFLLLSLPPSSLQTPPPTPFPSLCLLVCFSFLPSLSQVGSNVVHHGRVWFHDLAFQGPHDCHDNILLRFQLSWHIQYSGRLRILRKEVGWKKYRHQHGIES